jgi:eukaryotic-like serine/threonine-protein kinase
MGEVWAGRLRREHGFQKLFAIKVLRAELSNDPEFVRMFVDEAAVAARIRHPNVVSVVDLGEEGGTLFHVMEWVSGEPLSAVRRAAPGRPAPVLVAARIAYQICAGLDAAHELRDDTGNPLELVHCDVSPENILVTSEGLVRLVDFGVAKFDGEQLVEVSRARGTRERGVAAACGAQPGRGSGTPALLRLRGKAPYMAPEHILGQPYDRRADLFAVGLLLYELLSGVHPFLADDDQITMTRIASARPAVPLCSRVRARRRGLSGRLRVEPFPDVIPPALDRLVSAALAKSPPARIATAAHLMRALDEAVPGAALASNDAAVAAWTNGILGSAFQLRTQQLRAALESLDSGAGEIDEPDPPPLPLWSRVGWAAGAAVLGCALAGSTAVGDGPLGPPASVAPRAPAAESVAPARYAPALTVPGSSSAEHAPPERAPRRGRLGGR